MDQSGASSKQLIASLLTEHLKYTPITLIDDIINTVNELVFRAVTAVEEGLINTSPESLGFAEKAAAEGRAPEQDIDGNPAYPEAKAEIETGVHELETLLEATVDKTFDKLEIYVLRNILTVNKDLAPWMRLPHYNNLDFSEKPNTISPETLFRLRRKLQETRKLHDALQAEHSRNAAIMKKLQDLLRPSLPQDSTSPSLSFLTPGSSARAAGIEHKQNGSQKPLTSNTAFSVAQLPALRKLLDELRPKFEALESTSLRRDGVAEERSDYIDTQTRRQLEKNGVDVDTGEGLRGPGFDRVGVVRSAEQVKAMERVAEALAGQDEYQQQDQGADPTEE